jgi:hypothetical protein
MPIVSTSQLCKPPLITYTHSSPSRPATYCFQEAVSSETQLPTDFQKISSGNAGGKRLMTIFVLAASVLLDPPGLLS